MINIHYDKEQRIIYATVHGQITHQDVHENVENVVEKILSEVEYINGVLIDAIEFTGWESLAAFAEHINFVQEKHQYIKRVAIVVEDQWQRLIATLTTMIDKTEVKTFDLDQKDQASEWIIENI